MERSPEPQTGDYVLIVSDKNIVVPRNNLTLFNYSPGLLSSLITDEISFDQYNTHFFNVDTLVNYLQGGEGILWTPINLGEFEINDEGFSPVNTETRSKLEKRIGEERVKVFNTICG